VAETPAAAIKINNLEDIHCVRDARAAGLNGRSAAVKLRVRWPPLANVGLITCRSQVQILSPQPDNAAKSMTWRRFNLAFIAGIIPVNTVSTNRTACRARPPNIRPDSRGRTPDRLTPHAWRRIRRYHLRYLVALSSKTKHRSSRRISMRSSIISSASEARTGREVVGLLSS
jgi:hypothetical protein